MSPSLILRYLIDLQKKGLSSRSLAQYLSSLRGFYRFLCNEQIIEINPIEVVDLLHAYLENSPTFNRRGNRKNL